MKWPVLKGVSRSQPSKGDYASWKPEIASVCGRRCIYCALSEARNGGLDNFHVEHFKPKVKFPNLIDTISNLYLACAICNRFKGDDWPTDSLPKYLDPAGHNYNDHFDMSSSTWSIQGRDQDANYIEIRLYLNRPQLLMERRSNDLEAKALDAAKLINTAIPLLAEAPLTLKTKNLAVSLLAIGTRIQIIINALSNASPYEIRDIRRAS